MSTVYRGVKKAICFDLFRSMTREELIARLLGAMQAPIIKFVRTLNEIPSRFVRTLAAVRDAKAAS